VGIADTAVHWRGRIRLVVPPAPLEPYRAVVASVYSSGATLGLERHEFDNYIAGGSEACLLMLENVQRLEPPLELADLRRTKPFRLPQSYRYVSGDDPARIRDLIALE